VNAKPKDSSVVRGTFVVSRQGAAITVKGLQLTSTGTGILTSTVVAGIGTSDPPANSGVPRPGAARR
jgi:hypothetical protein